MKKVLFRDSCFILLVCSLLLSNFSAFSQKTTIWLVAYAETNDSTATNKQPGLNLDGQKRAQDLVKALKHENIKAIYTTNKKAADQTAAPLAQKDKILPRIYTDSVKSLVAKIRKNFDGSNVLIVGPYYSIIPFVMAFGGRPPFESLTRNDYDLLFSVTLHDDDAELLISYYGKSHHETEIPQQYILQNYYPGFVPPLINH